MAADRSSGVVVCLVGFTLALSGLYLIAGLGWALLLGGLVLFLAGGLDARERR